MIFECSKLLVQDQRIVYLTTLSAPNDIIIDASMPVVVRDSGKMWNKLGELEDTKCLIPDRSYATMYQECINYVKTNGQFDVATMGNVVSNFDCVERSAISCEKLIVSLLFQFCRQMLV